MSNLNKIVIGKTEFTVLFPDLPSATTIEEDKALKNSVIQNGVTSPITVDDKMGIIDGRRTARIASELGLKEIPFTIRPNLSGLEKLEIAVTQNSNRRQWSKDEKKQITGILRKEQFSLNRIADILAVGAETVRRWLNCSDEKDEFPDTIVGKDGTERPANMARKPIILARSVNEAKQLTDQLQLSDATKDLRSKIIYGSHLERELYKGRKSNPPDGISPETICDDYQLYLGDFREECERIEDESVDILFTDPPYSEDSLVLVEDLAELAHRILKPSGVLLSYIGNMYIPSVHQMMGKHLEYVWTFAVRHTGGNSPINNLQLYQSWKPVVCYQKPPRNVFWTKFVDMTSGGKSKEYHEWQQPEEEAHYFLSHLFAEPRANITLLDPLMGSGSVILAGLSLQMHCIGVDIDTTAYATAKQLVEHRVKKSKTNDATTKDVA